MKTQIKISDTRYPSLTRAVLASVDRESLVDVCNHGAAGGFGNFIYSRDMLAFYAKHRAEILALAGDMANDLGEDMLAMIAGFNCLKSCGLTASRIGEALWGDGTSADAQTVRNAMAWFALEEVARELNPDL